MLLLGAVCRGDAPATEFFAVDTARLAKLATNDAALDSLSSNQLAEISTAHGYYDSGLAMRFQTAAFRIDARFGGSADSKADAPPITYLISAGTGPTGWNVLSEQGLATKHGKQFVTGNWRTKPITVILRFVDLKK